LALVGRANDSSLSDLRARTNEGGEAEFRVLAGTTASAFSVRVTAPRAAPILVDVSVSDAGFGGLVVDVTWEGVRLVETVRVAVFTGMTCDDSDVLSGDADRERALLGGEASATFLALPAELSYAVTATGIGPLGDAVARGCVDGVRIEADVDVEATVIMTDLPLESVGTYSTLIDLDAEIAAESISRAVSRGGRSSLESAGGDADYLLNRVEAHLRASGAGTSADAIAAERTSSFLDDALRAALTTEDVGPSRSVDALSELLASRAARIQIEGRTALSETDPAFEVMLVSTGDAESTMPRLVADLVALGVRPAGRLAFTPLPEEDAIRIDEIGTSLPLGALGTAALDALVAESPADDLAMFLEARAGCTILAGWAASEPIIDGVCDGDCVLAVCRDVLEDVAAAIYAELETLDLVRSDLSFEGVVDAADDAGDLRVDAFSADALSGRYAGPDGTDFDEVTATVTGARVID
jgi:hypothetical protein